LVKAFAIALTLIVFKNFKNYLTPFLIKQNLTAASL